MWLDENTHEHEVSRNLYDNKETLCLDYLQSMIERFVKHNRTHPLFIR